MESFKPIFSFNIWNIVIDIKPEAFIQLAIVLARGVIAWWAIKDLLMNLMGLIGVPSPTKNFSVIIYLGVIAFFYIQGYAIKRIVIKHYLFGYEKPIAVMLPINILERVMLPVSLALSLFGNILAATFLVELVYTGLHMIWWADQIGLLIAFHACFYIFDGVIQMVIFSMLTMINIKTTVEH